MDGPHYLELASPAHLEILTMTVTVTLVDGGTDKYVRFGDGYIEHKDGTLDVTRGGAKHAYRYESGEWTHVDGDHRTSKKRGCWR
jgi:hypothetical protein